MLGYFEYKKSDIAF